jgi:sugar O-acyltransferase (sialic acid O-acetyltransferase NeuD family)
MKQVVILGAGGLGRQVLAQLQVDPLFGEQFDIAGFIDERGPNAVAKELEYPWLGYPSDAPLKADYQIVVAVGNNRSRASQVSLLAARGARFMSLKTRCMIGERTRHGATVFGFDACTGVDVSIGDYGFFDQDVLIGHDTVIGDFVHIAPRCVLAGYVKVDDRVTINSGAMIARGVVIGADATVGIGSVVVKDVPAGATVFGNPARVIFQKDLSA